MGCAAAARVGPAGATATPPPISRKRPDGSWEGLSIELWQEISTLEQSRAANADIPETPEAVLRRIKKLEQDMFRHARELEFEQAAAVRDEIDRLRRHGLGLDGQMSA